MKQAMQSVSIEFVEYCPMIVATFKCRRCQKQLFRPEGMKGRISSCFEQCYGALKQLVIQTFFLWKFLIAKILAKSHVF